MNGDSVPANETRESLAKLRRLISAIQCLRMDLIEMQLRRSPPLIDRRDAEIAEAILTRAARR